LGGNFLGAASSSIGSWEECFLFQDREAAMGTPLTPMQKAERDIEGLRQSIRQMFRDLSNLTLELAPEDRAAISKGIQSLQDDLKWEQQKFERGN
jgi:hypothetical protein